MGGESAWNLNQAMEETIYQITNDRNNRADGLSRNYKIVILTTSATPTNRFGVATTDHCNHKSTLNSLNVEVILEAVGFTDVSKYLCLIDNVSDDIIYPPNYEQVADIVYLRQLIDELSSLVCCFHFLSFF